MNLLEELGDELSRYEYYGTTEKLYLKILELAERNKLELENYGNLCLKLGNTYQNLKKFDESLEMFEEAKRHLEGEKERNEVDEHIEEARFL